MSNITDSMKSSIIVPVVVIEDAKDAVPTAKALLAGGIGFNKRYERYFLSHIFTKQITNEKIPIRKVEDKDGQWHNKNHTPKERGTCHG